MTDDRYVQCRTLGHAWVPTGLAGQGSMVNPRPPKNADSIGITEMSLVCDRCKTLRFDYIRRAGTIFRRKYMYPDGYLLAKGEERHSRVDYRLRLLSVGLTNLMKRSK